MRVAIDLSMGDQNRFHAGGPMWTEPCFVEDDGAITLHMGAVDLTLSYGQFEVLLDNIQRWRWSLPAERGPVDLTADNPPPTWDDFVQAVATDMAGERHTLAVDLELRAQNHGLLDKPADGDRAALRAHVAGRSLGVREGLLMAAGIIRERMARLDPPGAPALPPAPRLRRGKPAGHPPPHMASPI